MSVVEQTDVDLTLGLSDEQVARNREQHGSNRLTPLEGKSVLDFVKEAVSDRMLQILIVCAVIKLGLGFVDGDFVDGIAIMMAVLIVTSVGVFNQLRAQKDYSALDEVAAHEAVRVIRAGEVVEIDTEELVYGDVVEINTGDVIPADMEFARGSDLMVNEAHITGEPDTYKHVGDTLFGSSRILDGSGRGVVSTVGDATLFGKIRQEIGERDKTTPLEERLNDLAEKIGTAGKYAAALTFLALFGRAWIDGFGDGVLVAALDAVTIAITIVVVAVPEGLPLAVTLSLAYTTRKMAQDNALVRELSACETMGAATIVCSDKTGTLTAGKMTLASGDLLGRSWSAEELGSFAAGSEQWHDTLVEGVAVNSSADLIERDGEVVVAGNSTEGALLHWLDAQGVEYRPIRDSADVVHRREFNSSRKHMLTAIRTGGGDLRVHVKGAPEIVLGMCSTIVAADGSVVPLADQSAAIIEAVRGYAMKGNRTLGLAVATKPGDTDEEAVDGDLTFLGLFVIADPIRPAVADAVAKSRRAGVKVMIITGDIRETAVEIGRQAGIVDPGAIVLEGHEFRAMSDDDVRAQLPRIQVLARALPEDKKRTVELLQGQGEVVAVTGDGVNDAPALVTADVGFSMGSGSKVAREASDIVIVDDNFVSLVNAIRWGRSVFENIRKFLQFQLTVNVVALATAFIAALAGYGTPLTAVQLLWVNLIMDSLAALALALEPPTDELFDQPPHGREEPLISRSMWINVLSMGAYMFVLLIVVLLLGDRLLPAAADADAEIATLARNTLLFNVFVWLQIFNEVNSRSVRFYRSPFRGIFHSPSFLSIVGIIIVLQIVIISVGGSVFSTTPLDLRGWLLSIALGATVIPVSLLIRAVGAKVVQEVRVTDTHPLT